MKKMIFAAVAALGLSGCVYDGYSSGLSVGYGSGYGYNYGYPYGNYGYSRYGYSRYGHDPCVTYDRYGRQYYRCGFGGYYGSSRYGYSPRAIIYYPGYTYRNGYYYDRYNRRYDSDWLYRRHHRHHRIRRH